MLVKNFVVNSQFLHSLLLKYLLSLQIFMILSHLLIGFFHVSRQTNNLVNLLVFVIHEHTTPFYLNF